MKGFIKIEAATHDGREGLSVETDLYNVSYMDRLQVLHSVCCALKITPAELKLMAGLIDSGFADEVADVEVLHDESVPEEDPECDCDKKPKVHVIGLDASADGVAELLKMLLK